MGAMRPHCAGADRSMPSKKKKKKQPRTLTLGLLTIFMSENQVN